MNNVQIFNSPDFGDVRTVIINNEPWFVGKDIAAALGYEKERNAIHKNVDSEDALKWGVPTNGGVQEMTIINESGLYSLIFGSKLESAKKFKHWVTSEVLPQIRKTGGYGMPQQYVKQDIPLGEVASYLKVMDRVAVRQDTVPYKIAQAFKTVSEQFGVQLPDDFVKIPEYEQMTMKCVTVAGEGV